MGRVRNPSVKICPPRAISERDFELLFEEQLAYVTTLLGRFGVSKRDLPDVAHEVFLQVFRNYDQFDSSRPIRPWLFGIAFRAASNHRRSSHHRLELVENYADHSSDAAAAGAEQTLIDAEQRAILELALREIELDRRAVLMLHEIEGRRITEIAKILGLNLNTTYSRLRLARREFEAAVKRLQARGTTR